MGIPTTTGISLVLKKLQSESYTTVHWISLREEPVVYINENPYVLRDASTPFRNLEYKGISSADVESMVLCYYCCCCCCYCCYCWLCSFVVVVVVVVSNTIADHPAMLHH